MSPNDFGEFKPASNMARIGHDLFGSAVRLAVGIWIVTHDESVFSLLEASEAVLERPGANGQVGTIPRKFSEHDMLSRFEGVGTRDLRYLRQDEHPVWGIYRAARHCQEQLDDQ